MTQCPQLEYLVFSSTSQVTDKSLADFSAYLWMIRYKCECWKENVFLVNLNISAIQKIMYVLLVCQKQRLWCLYQRCHCGGVWVLNKQLVFLVLVTESTDLLNDVLFGRSWLHLHKCPFFFQQFWFRERWRHQFSFRVYLSQQAKIVILCRNIHLAMKNQKVMLLLCKAISMMKSWYFIQDCNIFSY